MTRTRTIVITSCVPSRGVLPDQRRRIGLLLVVLRALVVEQFFPNRIAYSATFLHRDDYLVPFDGVIAEVYDIRSVRIITSYCACLGGLNHPHVLSTR